MPFRYARAPRTSMPCRHETRKPPHVKKTYALLQTRFNFPSHDCDFFPAQPFPAFFSFFQPVMSAFTGNKKTTLACFSASLYTHSMPPPPPSLPVSPPLLARHYPHRQASSCLPTRLGSARPKRPRGPSPSSSRESTCPPAWEQPSSSPHSSASPAPPSRPP